MANEDFLSYTVSNASVSDMTDSSYWVLRLCLSSTDFDNVLRPMATREMTSFKVFSSHLQGQKQNLSYILTVVFKDEITVRGVQNLNESLLTVALSVKFENIIQA